MDINMKKKFSLGLLSLSEESKLFESLDKQGLDYEYSSSQDKVLLIECTSKVEKLLEKQGCQAIKEEAEEKLENIDQTISETLESFKPNQDISPDDFSGVKESNEIRKKSVKEAIERALGKKIFVKENVINDMVKIDEYRKKLFNLIKDAEASGVRKDEIQQMLNTILSENEGERSLD